MKITLENRFHNTEATMIVKAKKDGEEFQISRRTLRRLDKALCPHNKNSCSCGAMVQTTGKWDYQVVSEDSHGNQIARLTEKY